MNGLFLTGHRFGDRVEPCNGQQPEADQQEARHCATTKRHNQGCIQPVVRGLGRPHIGSNGDDHAHIAGERRRARADQEPNRCE